MGLTEPLSDGEIRVLALIREAEQKKFATLTIKFQDGKPICADLNEHTKLA